MGAHIAGQAAKLLKSKNKIECIIGLDPAGIGFDYHNVDSRLAISDAEYVQVIHTDGDKFGMIQPIGDGIFYIYLFNVIGSTGRRVSLIARQNFPSLKAKIFFIKLKKTKYVQFLFKFSSS